jgi:hypothetical protein
MDYQYDWVIPWSAESRRDVIGCNSSNNNKISNILEVTTGGEVNGNK